MMNVLAIGLVLTSLVTASMWSPSPPSQHDNHREVIVKEGHRVVVVEYDKEADGSTKVLISPQDADLKDPASSEEEKPGSEGMFSGPRELVCDAYGKCKHKMANALGKTKEAVTETAHGVTDKAHEVGERAKEAVNGLAGKTPQDLSESKDKLSEKVTGHTIGESLGKAKDSVSHGIGKTKKVAEDVVGTVKDGAVKVKEFDVVDSPKRIGEDISRNVTGKIEEGVEHAKRRVEETVENVQDVGQKTLREILSKLKEVTYDILWYLVSRDKLESVVGLIHMLGFSTAYGMCVWVTFISSYILGRYLPRQQFGMVQSRIYPVYFKAMAYCVSAALLGHLLGHKSESLTSKMGMFQSSSLLSALVMVLSNLVLLEPRATKLMFERMKIEKEEGRGMAAAAAGQERSEDESGGATVVRPVADVAAERQDLLRLDEKLRRLNGYSSALNVSTLVVLTWHMAYMAQRLQAIR